MNLDDFSRIVITNGGALGIVSDTVMTDWDLSRFEVAGSENSFIAVQSTNGVAFPSSMVVSNYTLHLDVPVEAVGDWRIATGSSLGHSFGSYLDLALDGNLTVYAGGAVSAHRSGYLSGGPGGMPGNYSAGASHGGRGGVGYTTFAPTYGSIICPTNWGSQKGTRGGGAVKLDIGGTLTVDGSIDADGDRTFSSGVHYGGGTGGSVWLQSATFAGDGKISVNGSDGLVGPGGGGRISMVELIGSGLPGLIVEAKGGYSNQNRYSAPGTICRHYANSGDGAGTVTVYASSTWDPGTNLAGTNTYCELPAATLAVPNELEDATLRICGDAGRAKRAGGCHAAHRGARARRPFRRP